MTTISYNHTELQQLAGAVGQIPMTKDGWISFGARENKRYGSEIRNIFLQRNY